MTSGTCEACGDLSLGPTGIAKRFCCERCRTWGRAHPGEPRPTGRTCRHCGASVDHMNLSTVYCSQACGQRGRAAQRHAARPHRDCAQCGASFVVGRCTATCCSVRCYRAWWQKCWAEANPDRVRETRLKVRQNRTPEQRARDRRDSALRAAMRRARKASNGALPFTAADLAKRMSMFPGCWMCGGPFENVDHVKPISRGGPHMLANLRPACATCNQRKGARWPVETRLRVFAA